MNLSPADLGTRFQSALIKKRLGRRGKSTHSVRPGAALTRLWTRDLKVSDEAMNLGMPAVRGAVEQAVGIAGTGIGFGLFWMAALPQQDWIGATLGAGGLIGAIGYGLLVGPRRQLQKLHESPVTEEELAALGAPRMRALSVPEQIFVALTGQILQPAPVGDPLDDAYLLLAGEALRLDIGNPDAEAELRSALKALGDAVAALPAPAPIDSTQVADLLGDADLLLARARRESDPVVADSLQRQAEATVRHARALSSAAKIGRRTTALRQEVLAQIDALRAALPALARSSRQAAALSFTAVSQSVHNVAREAASVAAAQEELAVSLSPGRYPRAAEDVSAVQIQRLGQ
jgi:hypothetical protein